MRNILSILLITLISFMLITTIAIGKETQTSQVAKPQPVTEIKKSEIQGRVSLWWPSSYPVIENPRYHVYYLKWDNSITYKEANTPEYIIKNGKHEATVYAYLDIVPKTGEDGLYVITIIVEDTDTGKFSIPSLVETFNTNVD